MAGGARDRAPEDRQLDPARRDHLRRPRQDHRDREPGGQLLRGLERLLVATVDQALALRLQRHARGRRHVERGLGEQRRDLGQRLRPLLRPAGALADVDVGDRAFGAELGARLLEQRRLLGAADDHRRAARDRLLEVRDLRPAELAVHLARPRVWPQARASALPSSAMLTSQLQTSSRLPLSSIPDLSMPPALFSR